MVAFLYFRLSIYGSYTVLKSLANGGIFEAHSLRGTRCSSFSRKLRERTGRLIEGGWGVVGGTVMDLGCLALLGVRALHMDGARGRSSQASDLAVVLRFCFRVALQFQVGLSVQRSNLANLSSGVDKGPSSSPFCFRRARAGTHSVSFCAVYS